MASIKSKIHSYGHEHESQWPPRFPKKARGCVGYWDKEAGCFREGYPPDPNPKLDTAPIAIMDSMPPTYHERACRTVESRKEWERLDRETNSITFSSIKESRSHIQAGANAEAKALRQDRRRASEEALKKVRANPREINQKWQKHAEKQLETAKKSGFDTLLKEKGIV
jgi:hypothetical protein